MELTVDDEVFRSDGGEITLLTGSGELTLVVDGKPVLLAVDVTDSFSRLPAVSEQKLASDEDEATQSSLLAVDATVRLLFASESTSCHHHHHRHHQRNKRLPHYGTGIGTFYK